jgi:transcriptional regulator GlxA family with amidase domain
MHSVAALAIDGAVGFELATPAQVLGAARTQAGDRLYDVRVCGAASVGATANGQHLFALRPPYRLRDALDCETIVVPASTMADRQPESVLRLLRTAHDRGIRIASICTGAFVLASAGLLDGRRATTHWAHTAHLAGAFPTVEVDPSVLFVDEGDILTSAGVAGGIDLCIHLIRRDHGFEVASRAARRVVMPPQREGGQAQFVRHHEVAETGGGFAEVLHWMQENLHTPIGLDQIAARANVSTRTLVRRFPEETGLTALQWLIRERVRRAQLLLESTAFSIEEIAVQTGFRDAARLRQHFKPQVGTTPQAYRRSFRVPDSSTGPTA